MKQVLIYLMLTALFIVLPVTTQATESAGSVGGISILKTDLAARPLEGATFQVARELNQTELTNRKIDKQILKVGDKHMIVTLESFWTDRGMTGELQKEVISNDKGMADIYGLPYGTYYLLEQKAPEGYNRITDPIRISIHKYSHLTQADAVYDDKGNIIDNTLHIVNVRYTLPETGNIHTLQLAASGIGILFSAVSLILMNRKRWN